MFFGTREITKKMGTFSSSKCSKCKNGYTYTFNRTTKYLVAFFINLIPLGTTYESVCEECEAKEAADTEAGKAIAAKEFSGAATKQVLLDIAKIAAVLVVIAAAVLLPLKIIKKTGPSIAALKALVDEDGIYLVQNEQGDMLAVVQVAEGQKTVSFYDDRSVLIGEPGADGSFIMHEYYEEIINEDGTSHLERTLDDVGLLEDRYKTKIRSYYYDLANESLGYAEGIEDLTTIEYAPDKVTYSIGYYMSTSDKQEYMMVMHLNDTYRLTATFIPALTEELVLAKVAIIDIENGQDTTATIYYLDSATMDISNSEGISVASSAEELRTFIEQNNIEFSYQETFTYYKDTNVYSQVTATMPDTEGNMQDEQQAFDVTEKNGYYILSEHIE